MLHKKTSRLNIFLSLYLFAIKILYLLYGAWNMIFVYIYFYIFSKIVRVYLLLGKCVKLSLFRHIHNAYLSMYVNHTVVVLLQSFMIASFVFSSWWNPELPVITSSWCSWWWVCTRETRTIKAVSSFICLCNYKVLWFLLSIYCFYINPHIFYIVI